MPNALGKGYFALGKAFAEGSTRQRASGKKFVGKEFFAECLLSGTRQRKVTVTVPVPLAHALPSAMSEALGKDFLIFFSKFLCRVPYRGGTRQRFFFNNFFDKCPARSALGKYFFFVISLPSALALALGKAGNSVRVRALGKEANFFFDSIFTNTAYKRYI